MNAPDKVDRNEDLWQWVENERQLDRKVRKINWFAWVATVTAVVLYGLAVLGRVSSLIRALVRDDVPIARQMPVILDALTPLIVVLGALSLLVAILSTIAMFLRFRTASLSEIQARLAAMESMLMKDPRKV
ncbi:MAG: hypothetical protein ACYC6F_18830 [Longimicrobiales bacterium]